MAIHDFPSTTLYTSALVLPLYTPSAIPQVPTSVEGASSTQTTELLTSTSEASFPQDSPSGWNNWSGGTKSGVLVGILLLIAGIVVLSCWCCRCGCFKGRLEKRNPPAPAAAYIARGNVPSRTVSIGGRVRAAQPQSESQQHLHPQPGPTPTDPDAPPPSYDAIRLDTIVPPSQHHRVGGQGVGEDEEFNVVADGKTPLSEIPFEDVDINTLSQPSSASSASNREFEERHQWGGGNTTGHTNS